MKRTFNLILILALWLTSAQSVGAVELTKTFSFSTASLTSDYLSIKATDPDDNTQKAILTVNGTMMDVYINSYPAFEISNMTSAVSGSGNEVQLFISPFVDGKVTKVEFTKAGRRNHQGGSTFSMSIDGMKYNGTDDALTGVGASGESTSFTFISTDAAGIAGNLTMRLGVDAQFFINKSGGCELKITYIPSVEPTHSHDFTFNAVGNTLTATCGHSDGLDCSLADANYQATLTLSPPIESFYRPGTYFSASHNLSAFNTQTGLNGTTEGIRYSTDGTNYTSDAPNAVGDYTARLIVTIGGTNYTLTQSFRVVAYSDIKNIYPQFNISTDDYASTTMAGEGQTVTITFTPKFGETLESLTVTGATTNYSIGSGITDNNDNTYTFTMPAEEVNIGATFSISEDDFAETGTNEYTIKTVNGWGWFCFAVNYDLAPDGFSGKTVKLAANVSSSEMAGKSGHPFKGTFDGQGNTLTFNRTAAEHLSAPFHYINGATISNLHVEGTITGGTYESLGGLVGHSEGNITINNCHVSTEISTTVSGSALHSGVIAQWNGTNATCTVTGCVYDGLIYNPNEAGVTTSCRGFIGWDYGNNMTITFTDCLSAPAAYGTDKYALGDNCFTFVYPNSEPTLIYNMTNCYYTSILGNRQGSPAVESADAPDNFAHFGTPTDHCFMKTYGHMMVLDGKYYTPTYGDLVETYTYSGEKSYIIEYDDMPLGIKDVKTKQRTNYLRYNRPFTRDKAVTIMLPFDFTKNDIRRGEYDNIPEGKFYEFAGIEEVPFNMWIAVMREVGVEGSNETTETTMKANTPYLFMPGEDANYLYFTNGDDYYQGFDIFTEGYERGNKQTEYDGSDGTYSWNKWNFKGTYQPRYWSDSENSEEIGKVYGFAGATKEVDEQLVVAGDFVRVKSGAKIRPTSCYLEWTGGETSNTQNSLLSKNSSTADVALPQRITVKFVNHSGETTSVGTLNTTTGEVTLDGWYTMDGVKLSSKPTKKGMYVNNGKTVVIE